MIWASKIWVSLPITLSHPSAQLGGHNCIIYSAEAESPLALQVIKSWGVPTTHPSPDLSFGASQAVSQDWPHRFHCQQAGAVVRAHVRSAWVQGVHQLDFACRPEGVYCCAGFRYWPTGEPGGQWLTSGHPGPRGSQCRVMVGSGRGADPVRAQLVSSSSGGRTQLRGPASHPILLTVCRKCPPKTEWGPIASNWALCLRAPVWQPYFYIEMHFDPVGTPTPMRS